MKPRKKNNFFTLVCSFCPGAAEMYMGFMKSGLSLLVVFAIPILIAIILYGGDYLVIISGIVYIFSFFHARNIATAPQEQFDLLEDKYIWEEFMGGKPVIVPSKIYRKWAAAALILAGISGIWHSYKNVIYNIIDCFRPNDYESILADSIVSSVPRLAFSIFVIVIGVALVRGKKKELIGDDADGNGSRTDE